MTDHPCAGMTRPQIAAFELIAISQKPNCAQSTLSALLERGVVVRGQDIKRQDAMGPYVVPTYVVPLPVHYQWCVWASEQPGEIVG